jgi:hypothetical protein
MPNKISPLEHEQFYFSCPACETVHALGTSWQWNGSLEKPTFSPSILVTSGHYMEGRAPGPCWCTFKDSDFHCFRCHSFITDGRIAFCTDSSHALAGQTVELPDWIPT